MLAPSRLASHNKCPLLGSPCSEAPRPLPRISTGMYSGRISSASNRPPRLRAHGQGRADGAEQAQHRRTEQQGKQQHRHATGRQAQHQREQRRHQDQGQPGKQPVCQHLGQHQKSQGCAKGPTAPENRPRNRCGTALPARAARPIAPPPRPGRATRFAAVALRPDRQGEQGDDDGEEHQRIGQLRRSAEQQARLARQERLKTLLMRGSPSAGSTVAPLAALSAPRSSSR